MTTPTRFRCALAACLATLPVGHALAQAPCLTTSPNDVFDDGISLTQNEEYAYLITNGQTPLTIRTVECFTGEALDARGVVAIRRPDATGSQPGQLVSRGDWNLDPMNSWQGAVLESPVSIDAGEQFWVTVTVDRFFQAPVERRVAFGTGDTQMVSRDGGRTWTGPVRVAEYKWRFFCYARAQLDQYGSGCGGSTGTLPPIHFFERFDAATNPLDLGNGARFTASGTDWIVATNQGALDPNYGTPLGLGDNQLSRAHPLGFDFPLRNGQTTDTIDIDSNGAVLLLSDPSNDWSSRLRASTFGSREPRILAWSTDLDPSAGGDVYLRTDVDRAVVTWLDVPHADGGGPNTVQLTMFDDGNFLISYGTISAGDGAVGYSLAEAPDLRENDITDPQGPPMHLGVDAAPALGTTIQVTTFDLPSATTLASLGIGFLVRDPAVDLSVLGMRDCFEWTRSDILLPSAISRGNAQTSIPIPNDPALEGLRTYVQANAVVPGANPLDLVLSDGYRLTLGR